MPLFIEAIDYYIKTLTLQDGTLVLKSRLKTGFLGFICDTMSAIKIYHELIPSKMHYLLTFKFSQDHLEIFFAAVRAQLGANNNPSCAQFSHIFKRFLVQHDIKSTTGNSYAQDGTSFLSIPSSYLKSTRRLREDSSEENDFQIPNLNFTSGCLSEFKSNVITYIAGFVVKMVKRNLTCQTCLDSLESTSPSLKTTESLLKRKKYGRLVEASPDVIKVCEVSEKLITQAISKDKDFFLRPNFALKVAVCAKQILFSKKD